MLSFKLHDEKAVVPSLGTPYSSGYDLTLISIDKKFTDNVTLYDTGVSVEPPTGYYTEIYARSSLSKSGHMIANSVGIIDSDYRGTLKVALWKDPSAPELELPFKGCQLIIRKRERMLTEVVRELSTTSRGDGGFGSTDLNDLHGIR